MLNSQVPHVQRIPSWGQRSINKFGLTRFFQKEERRLKHRLGPALASRGTQPDIWDRPWLRPLHPNQGDSAAPWSTVAAPCAFMIIHPYLCPFKMWLATCMCKMYHDSIYCCTILDHNWTCLIFELNYSNHYDYVYKVEIFNNWNPNFTGKILSWPLSVMPWVKLDGLRLKMEGSWIVGRSRSTLPLRLETWIQRMNLIMS